MRASAAALSRPFGITNVRSGPAPRTRDPSHPRPLVGRAVRLRGPGIRPATAAGRVSARTGPAGRPTHPRHATAASAGTAPRESGVDVTYWPWGGNTANQDAQARTASTAPAAMSEIRLVVMPYELARLRGGVGRGPERLLEHGIEDALGAHGARVSTELVELDEVFSNEIDAGFELMRHTATRVRPRGLDGAFPVVLSGAASSRSGSSPGSTRRRPPSRGSTPTPISTTRSRPSRATSTGWA